MKISTKKLSDLIIAKRKEKKMTQMDVANLTHINRAMLSKIESMQYVPSIEQLESLMDILEFDYNDIYEDKKVTSKTHMPSKKIAVAGTGYVGLSIATLLAQHNEVMAVDIIEEKVNLINKHISPIQDDYIEDYLKNRKLNLTATLDSDKAYRDAEYVVIAAPTNYDSKKNYFDTSAVENVIENVLRVNPKATMVIKSTIPVGYTESVKKKYAISNIIFSPEFLRESKALYDNLYPSRIIVGADDEMKDKALEFAKLLEEGAIKENIETLIMQIGRAHV